MFESSLVRRIDAAGLEGGLANIQAGQRDQLGEIGPEVVSTRPVEDVLAAAAVGVQGRGHLLPSPET
jgi:hypothetical protein